MSPTFRDIAGNDQASPRHRVLSELVAVGGATRAELARATALAPSTMTALIRGLREEGVVIDIGPATSSDGYRRSGPRGTALSINPTLVTAIGVDFGFRHVRVVVCDLFANILAERQARLSSAYSRDEGLRGAAALVVEAVSAAGVPPTAIVGAGVALPGPIDTHAQQVVQSDILAGWAGTTAADVSEALGIRAMIENDANLAALGEHVWGSARGQATTLTVKFHSGIGAGLIANHQLVTGAHGGAGEIGHANVDSRGAVCRCGKRGCLDTVAAVPAILAALSPRHEHPSVSELMDLLESGDPGAHRVVADAAFLVGQIVAGACLLVAPESVIVVGAMARAGDTVLAPIRRAVEDAAIPRVAKLPHVLLGALGDRHTSLGAVALALRNSGWLPPQSARTPYAWTGDSTPELDWSQP